MEAWRAWVGDRGVNYSGTDTERLSELHEIAERGFRESRSDVRKRARYERDLARGYSHVIQHSDNANVLLSAFSNALSDVHLQATAVGTVKVEPSEIALAKDQTISLDSSSRLLLDSKAKIVVEGEISVQAPTISSVQNSAAAIGPTAPTIVDFTVFKSVPFKEVSVLTGWKFLTSAQKFPSSQYCYYTEKSEASPLEPVVFIGTDERLTRPKHPPKDFDIDAAFTRCVWFNRELP
jgi:hypothetical protein